MRVRCKTDAFKSISASLTFHIRAVHFSNKYSSMKGMEKRSCYQRASFTTFFFLNLKISNKLKAKEFQNHTKRFFFFLLVKFKKIIMIYWCDVKSRQQSARHLALCVYANFFGPHLVLQSRFYPVGKILIIIVFLTTLLDLLLIIFFNLLHGAS